MIVNVRVLSIIVLQEFLDEPFSPIYFLIIILLSIKRRVEKHLIYFYLFADSSEIQTLTRPSIIEYQNHLTHCASLGPVPCKFGPLGYNSFPIIVIIVSKPCQEVYKIRSAIVRVPDPIS